jgi:hypothetical protein
MVVTERHETIGSLLAGCYRYVTSTLLVVLLCGSLPSAAAQATIYQSFVIGRINVDTTDRAITAGKVEAGTSVALSLTRHWRLIPNVVRDSILAALPTSKRTIADAMSATSAFGALFITTRRVGNLVRTEVVIAAEDGMKEEGRGVGYGLLRYKNDADGSPIADPAILASVQRALCVALHDSTLYANAESDFRVTPTSLVTIGGVEFTDTTQQKVWNLFSDKVVVSYDGAETIANAASSLDEFTLIDLETRDSMYVKAGLYAVENYKTLAINEIGLLRAFEVRFAIIGSFVRTRKGADLTLRLCELVSPVAYKPIRSATTTCADDTKESFRTAINEAMHRLFPEH